MSSELIKELKQKIKDKELKRDELIKRFNLNKLNISENNEYEESAIKLTEEFIKNINLNNKKLKDYIKQLDKILG